MKYAVWAQLIGNRFVLELHDTESEARIAMGMLSEKLCSGKPLRSIDGRQCINTAHVQFLEVAEDTYRCLEKRYGGE